MPIDVNGKSLETDEEGYLANLNDWEPECATVMAALEDQELITRVKQAGALAGINATLGTMSQQWPLLKLFIQAHIAVHHKVILVVKILVLAAKLATEAGSER